MRTAPTLVLLFFASFSQAQSPYRPFPESDAGWVERHGWQEHVGAALNFVGCTRSVTFGSDTVLQGTTYRRLRIQGVCDVQQALPVVQFLYSYGEAPRDLLYFRQDVAARKAYAWKNQQEVLLFDFNLPLGPYPASVLSYPQDLHVVEVDSVMLNDGWHRTWGLAHDPGQQPFVDIIEGVGTSQGLDPYVGTLAPPFEWFDSLDCHSAADHTIFPFGASECDLTTTVVHRTNRPAPSAYPNPATNLIRFTTDLPAGVRYTAFDATGAQVGSGTVQHAQLDCSEWPVGLYTITLSDATGGALGALRVVKE